MVRICESVKRKMGTNYEGERITKGTNMRICEKKDGNELLRERITNGTNIRIWENEEGNELRRGTNYEWYEYTNLGK
jgi:hypothetical protein